jgi:crotonobetainyl-CoA:carnitine CoA-transferase CaiB-like acyl-CoA transferase
MPLRDTAVTNCLRDHRVVSLAQNVPGPAAAAELCAMGAAVVKVEPPSGDPLAVMSPEWYAELTSGMEIIRVDLKARDGAAQLQGRLSGADLFLTSLRPSSLARLGLKWVDLHERYPRLCWVAIVGFPAPRQEVAGHDLTYQATHGLVAPPALPRTLLSDLAGAKQAVIAALDLLFARERGDVAGYAEVALSDAARFFAEPLRRGATTTDGILGGGLPTYNVYPARDGWVAVAALEPQFRRALSEALGGVDAGDRNALARAFVDRPAAEWQAWAEAHDLPIVEVRLTPRE